MTIPEFIWTIGSIISVISFLIQIRVIRKVKKVSDDVVDVHTHVDSIEGEINDIEVTMKEKNENKKT